MQRALRPLSSHRREPEPRLRRSHFRSHPGKTPEVSERRTPENPTRATCHSKGVILARATWTEVDALDRESVVVIPVGGTEGHGPSLPLGTSTIVAEAVAHALHDRLGEGVIVAPAIPYGVSGRDRGFPGTVDLGYEALIATLRSVVASLARHRFRRFLILTGGFEDTREAVKVALRAIKDENPNLSLAWRGAVPPMTRNRVRTRILFAVAPDLVRPATAPSVRLDLEADEGAQLRASLVTNDEDSPPEGRSYDLNPDQFEDAREHFDYAVEMSAKLIALMREGRVYVERSLTEEKETI